MTQLPFIKSDNYTLTPALPEVRGLPYYKVKLTCNDVNYLAKHTSHSDLWADKHAAPIIRLKYCDAWPRYAIKPPNGLGRKMPYIP